MTTVRRVRKKRFAINGGQKIVMVIAVRGTMKISWVSTESSLIRIRRTETRARLTRPTIPFLFDSLRIANQENEIKTHKMHTVHKVHKTHKVQESESRR